LPNPPAGFRSAPRTGRMRHGSVVTPGYDDDGWADPCGGGARRAHTPRAGRLGGFLGACAGWAGRRTKGVRAHRCGPSRVSSSRWRMAPPRHWGVEWMQQCIQERSWPRRQEDGAAPRQTNARLQARRVMERVAAT
jgi:hypothetical protein